MSREDGKDRRPMTGPRQSPRSHGPSLALRCVPADGLIVCPASCRRFPNSLRWLLLRSIHHSPRCDRGTPRPHRRVRSDMRERARGAAAQHSPMPLRFACPPYWRRIDRRDGIRTDCRRLIAPGRARTGSRATRAFLRWRLWMVHWSVPDGRRRGGDRRRARPPAATGRAGVQAIVQAAARNVISRSS